MPGRVLLNKKRGFRKVDVATAAIPDNAVGTSEIASNAVTAGKLATNAVTFAKAKASVSAEQTGTGSSQNVAHGLGVAPAAVLIVPTVLPDAAAETGFSIVEGTHTTTNVVVTVTSTVKFKVLAWA